MEHRRDKRQANWFWMNKSIVDEYGSQIGAIGIAVYAILARCANEDGHAFPSVRYIARHLGLSTNTVLKYLGMLEKCRLVTIKLRRDPAGDKDSTEYTLLTPIIEETQEGVSSSDTPKGPKTSSSANKRGSRKEVSNLVRHGVSYSDTPKPVEVSNEVRHGVSTNNAPNHEGVSQFVKEGVSTSETFKDQENKEPITQDLKPSPLPPMGEQKGVGVAGDGREPDTFAARYSPRLKPNTAKVLAYLNHVTEMAYTNGSVIEGILSTGATVDDCALMIDWWDKKWTVDHPNQRDHFDSATPFKKDIFDKNLPKARKWQEQGRQDKRDPRTGPNGLVI